MQEKDFPLYYINQIIKVFLTKLNSLKRWFLSPEILLTEKQYGL